MVMVYYAIALTLYDHVSTREVLRCLLKGVRWRRAQRTPTAANPHSDQAFPGVMETLPGGLVASGAPRIINDDASGERLSAFAKLTNTGRANVEVSKLTRG